MVAGDRRAFRPSASVRFARRVAHAPEETHLHLAQTSLRQVGRTLIVVSSDLAHGNGFVPPWRGGGLRPDAAARATCDGGNATLLRTQTPGTCGHAGPGSEPPDPTNRPRRRSRSDPRRLAVRWWLRRTKRAVPNSQALAASPSGTSSMRRQATAKVSAATSSASWRLGQRRIA